MVIRRATACALAAALLVPAGASAQTVSDALLFLLTNQSVETGSPATDRAAALATGDTIARALLASLATLPVPTSSSAFVYRLNPELGTVERTTEGFGPSFVERAQTVRRGQASFGLAFQSLRFDSLDGANLRDGSFVTTANQYTDEAQPFDVDRLTLAIDAAVATFYGSVGVTDRLEVGVAAPLVSLRIDGSRVDTYRGRAFTQATATARAIGFADLVTRAKFAIYDGADGGVAAAVDLRLPTGRRDDLLGAGSTSLRLGGIATFGRGAVASHVNAGVAVGGLAREATFAWAIEAAASPRVTIDGEIVGRSIAGAGRIQNVPTPNATLEGVDTIRLVPDGSRLVTLTAVPGVKWNLSNTWVLAANVAVPLTSAGLVAPLTPFVGLDYAWTR
jgi:hypothetical protein